MTSADKKDSSEKWMESRLTDRQQQGLYRTLPVTRSLIDFSSNDYLGLARSSELLEMIDREVKKQSLPNGATGSRLLSGNDPYTEDLERMLAGHFHGEAALLMNSGYVANTAVLSSLPQKDDTIIYDELAHASIKDGARLSLARRHSFRHNDAGDLERKISRGGGRKFVAIESIYSMDGDASPLKEIVDICERHGALLILDEAHSTGVFGKDGAGVAVDQGLQTRIAVRVYTFGKGMGAHGACVVGTRTVINYIINYARPFIYTTALPPHSVAGIKCAFSYLKVHPELAQQLNGNIAHYVNGVEQIDGLQRTESHSAIQTVIVPGNPRAHAFGAHLQSAALDVRPILSPTVRAGSERVRICLHVFNTRNEISQLVRSIEDFQKR